MKIKLILALFLFQLGFSQQKSCGTDSYMQQMMSDPVAKQKYLDLQNRFEIELAKLQNQQNKSATNTNTTIIIPVAVHFPEIAANSPIKGCLQLLAQNQIDIINTAFNATNSDLALWTSQVQALYPGTNVGNPNIQFVLATKNHPAGSGLVNGQEAITFGTGFLNYVNRDINWAGYLNIVCRSTNQGGYYTGGNPDEGNLIVLNPITFGSGAGCPGFEPYHAWNLGRNGVHEIGHYFNVNHTFGKAPGDNVCLPSNTDEVDDTPQCQMTTSWPVTGSVPGCVPGTKSLTMNYMDYTLDSHRWMFTAGQVVRMRAYYNTVASQFATNVLNNEQFEFKDLSLYPNPNIGSFKILFEPANNNEIEIVVHDIRGRTIYEKSFQNIGLFEQDIKLEKVQSGIYLITIANGENKTTKRIIVE